MSSHDQVAWARRLKVKHLESFMVMDEAGTLTEAAAQMHMTQSAMSHWLADLAGGPLLGAGEILLLASLPILATILATIVARLAIMKALRTNL